MKTHIIHRLFTVLLLSIYIIGFYSCSDDDEVMPDNQNESTITTEPKEVCTEWGVSNENVQDEMKNFSLVQMQKDFLCYRLDKGYVSYHFENDQLVTALKLVPMDEDSSIDDIKKKLSHMESLGEFENYDVFIDTQKNLIVTIGKKAKDEIEFAVIGFAPISFD